MNIEENNNNNSSEVVQPVIEPPNLPQNPKSSNGKLFGGIIIGIAIGVAGVFITTNFLMDSKETDRTTTTMTTTTTTQIVQNANPTNNENNNNNSNNNCSVTGNITHYDYELKTHPNNKFYKSDKTYFEEYYVENNFIISDSYNKIETETDNEFKYKYEYKTKQNSSVICTVSSSTTDMSTNTMEFKINSNKKLEVTNKSTNESYVIKKINNATNIIYLEDGLQAPEDYHLAVLTEDGDVYASFVFYENKSLLMGRINPKTYENSLMHLNLPEKIVAIETKISHAYYIDSEMAYDAWPTISLKGESGKYYDIDYYYVF